MISTNDTTTSEDFNFRNELSDICAFSECERTKDAASCTTCRVLLSFSNREEGFSRWQRIYQSRHGVGESDCLSSIGKSGISKDFSLPIVRSDLDDNWESCVLNNPFGDFSQNNWVFSTSSSHTLLIHSMRARKVKLKSIESCSVGQFG